MAGGTPGETIRVLGWKVEVQRWVKRGWLRAEKLETSAIVHHGGMGKLVAFQARLDKSELK